ncbi:MAG: hypothetical protein B5M46_01815 [Epsilonproteobacteria bacterium 4484_20]|nr:MAG: hypothetical protein B5M46_01815 [Epsilonproteobacteria bacterium 4484_20]
MIFSPFFARTASPDPLAKSTAVSDSKLSMILYIYVNLTVETISYICIPVVHRRKEHYLFFR